jgi:hypothetical protein
MSNDPGDFNSSSEKTTGPKLAKEAGAPGFTTATNGLLRQKVKRAADSSSAALIAVN